MSKKEIPDNLIIDTIRWILRWVIRFGIIGFVLILILIGCFYTYEKLLLKREYK